MISPERFLKIRTLLQQRQTDLTLVMDNVNKPHNLAAILRSCDAVGIHEIHAVSYCQTIKNKQHTAAGANRWVGVNLDHNIEAVFTKLRSRGLRILVAACSPDSVDFRKVDYTLPTAIVVGQELTGPTGEALRQADGCIRIPMSGIIDSLNVSVAAAVILFEAQRQRQEAGMYRSMQMPEQEFNQLLFEYAYPRLSRNLREEGLPYPPLDANGAVTLGS